jgi:hypothetical protein
MSIKQNGGVFGRNPTFNDVTIEGDLIINGEVFTGLDFQGSWNASTNSPALASSTGTNGEFYIVSIAGTTNLNGITNWGIGDWALFNGTVWQRVEGGANGNFVDLTANSLTVNGLSDGNLANFQKSGGSVGSVGTVIGRLFIGNDDTFLTFQGAADRIYPASSSGGARDAAIDLGLGGGRFKDLYLSSGVYLGGTVAANKLDDYEEGTWTPEDGSTASLTFSTAVGTYVKVGKLVTLSYSVVYPSTADTTDMKMGGLPFTPNTAFRYAGSQSYTTSSAAAASTVTSSGAYILYRTEGTYNTINNDQLSLATLTGNFTYEV